jgi:hypothetical protein
MGKARADCYVMGHNHEKYHVQERVITLGNNHEEVVKPVQLIRCGTYKLSQTDVGWAVERGFGCSPQGGYWLKFTESCDRLVVDVISAD